MFTSISTQTSTNLFMFYVCLKHDGTNLLAGRQDAPIFTRDGFNVTTDAANCICIGLQAWIKKC